MKTGISGGWPNRKHCLIGIGNRINPGDEKKGEVISGGVGARRFKIIVSIKIDHILGVLRTGIGAWVSAG